MTNRHRLNVCDCARGVLSERYTTCGDDEDAASMALTAIHRLMQRCGVQPREVGNWRVATTAVLDLSLAYQMVKNTLSYCASNFKPATVT